MPVGFEISSAMYVYNAFDNLINSLSSMNPYKFLVWQIYFVSVFMPINGHCAHLCITPRKCIDSLKYFTFVSHICSFISMIPLVFLV